MEGVGARLGRSSTRYGPATVFTGPVRKWKKKWVHVSPPTAGNNHHNHHATNASSNNLNGAATMNGGNNAASHLILYKWTPITPSGNANNVNSNGNSNGVDRSPAIGDAAPEEPPPRRKFKYIPIALLEEQKDEAVEDDGAENVENEEKPNETEPSTAEPNSKIGGSDEKPDINDIPMEENEDDNKGVRQDLNESTLDLSLSLKEGDGNQALNAKSDQLKDGQLR